MEYHYPLGSDSPRDGTMSKIQFGNIYHLEKSLLNRKILRNVNLVQFLVIYNLVCVKSGEGTKFNLL